MAVFHNNSYGRRLLLGSTLDCPIGKTMLNKRTKKLKKSYSSIKTKRTQTAANVTLFGEHSALLLPTVVLLCTAALMVERARSVSVTQRST